MKEICCTTTEETQDIGLKLGQILSREVCATFSIALTGDLGTGKTTLIQGLAKGMGVDNGYYITSPTFNIINEYPAGEFRLCHLDLYRLGSSDELDYIGFDDLLMNKTIIAVEWPDLLRETGFEFNLDISLKFDADFNRVISLFPSGQQALNLLSKLFL